MGVGRVDAASLRRRGDSSRLCAARAEERAHCVDQLRLLHVEVAVVFLSDKFIGFEVDSQAPKPDGVHLPLDTKVDACPEYQQRAVRVQRILVQPSRGVTLVRQPVTLIGRPFLYGLGAMGEAGVTRALEIIAKELDLTMAFCGHTDIQRVDRRVLLQGTY